MTAEQMAQGASQSGKAALVTGAASGIGRAIAQALGRQGWRVACADVAADGARETAAALPVGSFAVEADITVPDDAARMVDEAVTRLGGIDGFVGAAGVQVKARLPADEMPLDEWNRVLATNLTGTFVCATSVARAMRRHDKPGAIVLVGSIASQSVPVEGIAPYVASKAGLEGLGRALAVDWAPYGIRVNTLAPGIVHTALTERSLSDDAYRERLQAQIPAGRIATPDDIAGAATFLLSDAARYITGACLPVDGGWTAYG